MPKKPAKKPPVLAKRPYVKRALVEPNDMEVKLIQALARGLCPKDAAIAAGYSESSADSTVYTKLMRPNFLDKVRVYADQHVDARRELAKFRLSQLARIEQKVLDKAETDPAFAAKHSKALERDYRISGLVQPDNVGQQTIQIGTLNVLQAHISGKLSDREPDLIQVDDKVKS